MVSRGSVDPLPTAIVGGKFCGSWQRLPDALELGMCKNGAESLPALGFLHAYVVLQD